MNTLAQQIDTGYSVPYVYTYPPTRALVPIQKFSLDKNAYTDLVNVYIHIPFCEQQCTFCGYLTLIDRSRTFFERYVDCIVREIEQYRSILGTRSIESVNFGGGTPSLLSIPQFERIMSALKRVQPHLLETAKEISIEATPESIQTDKIHRLKEMGFNRVSIGIQSFDDREIAQSGRHNKNLTTHQTLKALMDVGIPNICCDLMYGLRGQSKESWYHSVRCLIAYRPQTIELYSTVTIPGTTLARTAPDMMTSTEKYQCYEYARDCLLNAGYVHDCHLRFIIPGQGFYRQQENVFKGQSLIGVGVGARTYADTMHYRNVYDTKNSTQALEEYMKRIEAGNLAVQSCVTLSLEERMRRYIIYNLEHLDTDIFLAQYGTRIETIFGKELSELYEQELIEKRGNMITMTPKGLTYRDLAAHRFFSDTIRKGEEVYYAKI